MLKKWLKQVLGMWMVLKNVGLFTALWSLSAIGQDSPGLSAFKKHIHPILRSECAHCHDGSDESIKAPSHSVTDASLAFERFKPYVNFNNIASSSVLKKISAKHWDKYGGGTEITEEAFKKALQLWWDEGQKLETALDGFSTEAQLLPPLSDKEVTPIKIPLNLSGEFEGLIFEVEAKRNGGSDSSALILTNPKLKFKNPETAKNGVKINGIRFLLDGVKVEEANNWETLDAVSYPGSVYPPLARSAIIIPMDLQKQKLTINFKDFEKRQKPKDCQNLELFQTNVLSTLNARGCAFCHGGGNGQVKGTPAAVAAFPMDVPIKQLCTQCLLRMFPLNEPPLLQTATGMDGHPKVLVGDEEAETKWLEWAETEIDIRAKK